MDVSMEPSSWHRPVYSRDFQQEPVRDSGLYKHNARRVWPSDDREMPYASGVEVTPGHAIRSTYRADTEGYNRGGWNSQSQTSLRKRNDDDVMSRQQPAYSEGFTSSRTPLNRYDQYDEGRTEFRSQFMKDLNQQHAGLWQDGLHATTDFRSTSEYAEDPLAHLQGNRSHNDNYRYQYYEEEVPGDNRTEHVDTSHSGPDITWDNSQMFEWERKRCTFDQSPITESFKSQSGDLDQQAGHDYIEEFEAEDYDLEGDENLDEVYEQSSWHKDQKSSKGLKSSSVTDWKRPDMHMFKASSHRGSVTSEKSSRLAPHTYQSYAAGILYSSGRSEKFLKLQKHFNILERIGDLDKTHPEQGGTGQDFHTKEELEELYSELKEARKSKEFFHQVDTPEEFHWSPDKDFGLKKKKQSLGERIRCYTHRVEEGQASKSPSSSPIKQEQLKRAVSFGTLYDKFGNPCISHHDEDYTHESHSKQDIKGETRQQPGKSRGDRTKSHDSKADVSDPNRHSRYEGDRSNVNHAVSSISPSTKGILKHHTNKDPQPNSQMESVHSTQHQSTANHKSPQTQYRQPDDFQTVDVSSRVKSKSDMSGQHFSEFEKSGTSLTEASKTSSPREISYLELMDNAAKKSKQRAIYGTHMDPHRNEYEVYVEEVKKLSKEEVEANNLHIRSMSAPHSSLKPPSFGTLPRSQSSKDSFFGAEEPKDITQSSEKPGTLKTISQKAEVCPVIDVGSSTKPKSGLQVKFGAQQAKDNVSQTPSLIPAGRQGTVSLSKRYDTATRPEMSKDFKPVSDLSSQMATTELTSVPPAGRDDTSSPVTGRIRHNKDSGTASDNSSSVTGRTTHFSASPDDSYFSNMRKKEKKQGFTSSSPSTSDVKTSIPKDYSNRTTPNTNTAYSETRQMKQNYSQMPDILQVERHDDSKRKPATENSVFHSAAPQSYTAYASSNTPQHTVPEHVRSTPLNSSAYASSHTPQHRVGEHVNFGPRNAEQVPTTGPWNSSISLPEDQTTSQHSSAVKPTVTDRKGAFFHVANLRGLAENNEFSSDNLSWAKRSSAGDKVRNPAQEYGDHSALNLASSSHRKPSPHPEPYLETNPDKPGNISSTHEQRYGFVYKAVPTYRAAATPESRGNLSMTEKTPPPPPERKSSSLGFGPTPCQSGPSFSVRVKGSGPWFEQAEATRPSDIGSRGIQPKSQGPLKTENFSRRDHDREMEKHGPTADADMKRREFMYVNEPQLSKGAPRSAAMPAREAGNGASGAEDRRPGDGDDQHDPQYGQLRKWTAVADIYRDVEKSWSPTREARPLPSDNNNSISSTDTFIVKDTDEEDNALDDMESSGASVSQLRAIFERRQKVSKSKSEPSLSIDSNEEPKRPRSAKSQTGLNFAEDEDELYAPRVPRTVSGDLNSIRHHYDDGQDASLAGERTSPTDTALRAWVQYTGRPRYDPYLPPEDILKEVSATATGRKLDTPRKRIDRPSNVGKMTMDYFDQIGSEWQRGGVRGSYRGTPQQPSEQQPEACGYPASTQQSYIDPNNRRDLSRQYVNEQTAYSASYLQTDDLKLKQSQQWAVAARFTPETPGQQSQPLRTLYTPQSRPAGAAWSASTTPQSWPPQVAASMQPAGSNSVTETKPSEGSSGTPGHDSYEPARRPRSQTPEVTPRSQTGRTPAVRPRSQPAFSSHSATHENDNARKPVPGPPQAEGASFRGEDSQRWNPREGPSQQQRILPPEPQRPPPASPRPPLRTPLPPPRTLQKRHSRSSDSELSSSGDFGGVYCVSTGSVWYGADAEEAVEPPIPPLPQNLSSLTLPSSSQTLPRSLPSARQTQLQPQPQPQPQPQSRPQAQQGASQNLTPKNHYRSYSASPSSSSLSPKAITNTAPAPPTRGGRGGVRSGAGTLPRAKSSGPYSGGSTMSAAEQLGVKSQPSSATVGFGSAASTGFGGSNPVPSAREFKHQTTDARRARYDQGPVDPEKERRRREAEEAERKKRLQELYEEERLKKIKRDEADAEARRHHDYFMESQKSPISPNRFDTATASFSPSSHGFLSPTSGPLSPSQPGSLGTLERKDQGGVPPERRRGFQIQGKARALYNFNAQNPRELSFHKNDIIYLLRQVDKNWFEGERYGRVGIFPSNYVEVVTSIEAARAAAMQAEGQGRARYNFTAQSSVEMSLRKGEFVVLLRRVDDNWFEGRIGNRQGIFPVSYVEITREPSTPLITPAPSVITTPMTGTPEMLSPVGYDAAPTPPPQPSPSALLSQRTPTGPYGYRQQPQQSQGAHFFSGPSPHLEPSVSSGQQQYGGGFLSNPKSPNNGAPSRSPILSPGGRMGSPSQGKKSPVPTPAFNPTTKLQVEVHSKAKPYANGQAKPTKVADDDLAVTRYRALYAYRPLNEDELELQEGDEVFVMEKCDDGWYVGTSARTGCFGTFPGNYVQKILLRQLEAETKSKVRREEMECWGKEDRKGYSKTSSKSRFDLVPPSASLLPSSSTTSIMDADTRNLISSQALCT